MKSSIGLCVLILSAIPSSVVTAQPATAPQTATFTGSASVNETVVFTSTGSMASARESHTATLLSNSKVLVTGGRQGNTYFNSAELYDPATGIWSSTGSMSRTRSYHTATLLSNGKVLVTGGEGSVPSPANSAELYDPATGIWSSTGSMSGARSLHTATLLSNGKVLVTGGSVLGPSLNSTELYDPATGTWSSAGSMSDARYYHSATLLNNGKVLVAGGCSSLPSPPYSCTFLNSAELYDPTTGTWSNTGNMSGARYVHTAILVSSGKVLVAGGYSGSFLNSAELYDPATGTWSNTGNMSGARYWHTAALLNNGKVLVVGGSNTVGTTGTLNSGELYDPATGTWSNTDRMSSSRSGHTTTLLSNGNVLVTGGFNDTTVLNSAEIGADTPTAVTLASFTATPASSSQVNVAWTTAMEVDVAGFNVWRSLSTSSGYNKINATLIPSQNPGGILGGSYLYRDSAVLPGTIYFYRLEIVNLNGSSEWAGPISTTAQGVGFSSYLPVLRK